MKERDQQTGRFVRTRPNWEELCKKSQQERDYWQEKYQLEHQSLAKEVERRRIVERERNYLMRFPIARLLMHLRFNS